MIVLKKIAVVGAGASGLVSAIFASRKGHDVTLIEKNEVCGKKILSTGNGRCNYWNEDQSIKHYRSLNLNKVQEILSEPNRQEILNFFKQIGIEPKIKNGYYYPFSNQASSMQKALQVEAIRQNVNMLNNCEVEKILKKDKKFEIILKDKKKIISDILIIATGSKSAPKTGSDGFGYKICEKFNHTIIKPLPALVQLRANEKYLKEWEGIRADVSIKLYENTEKIAEDKGEIQLTNYGISGICVFNLSGRVSRGLEKNKDEKVQINFLDGLNIKTKQEFILWMNKRDKILKQRTIMESLESVLNYKLVNVLLKLSNLKKHEKWNEINENKKMELAKNLIEFSLKITETNSFDKSQVCTGGVSLDEIDTKTMQSKKVDNFYIVGEILDADGDCGGYNLEWAWITGMIAGKNV